MRILVTGANGQVGQALADLGNTTAHQINALDRTELNVSAVESVFGAIQAHQPDLVINAAAYTAVDKAESEEAQAMAGNCDAPMYLAQACKDAGIPLFHISTDYVFDGAGNRPYLETDAVNPLSVYGRSKEMGEQAVRDILPEHIVLRTSWVFSAAGSNFVKTMVRVGKNGGPLKVVNDQFGGPTSARAIAHALLHLADQLELNKTLSWGTYHFSQGPHVSWHAFATDILRQAESLGAVPAPVDVLPVPSSEYPTPVERPKNSRLDCTQFEKTFGYAIPSWRDELPGILCGL